MIQFQSTWAALNNIGEVIDLPWQILIKCTVLKTRIYQKNISSIYLRAHRLFSFLEVFESFHWANNAKNAFEKFNEWKNVNKNVAAIFSHSIVWNAIVSGIRLPFIYYSQLSISIIWVSCSREKNNMKQKTRRHCSNRAFLIRIGHVFGAWLCIYLLGAKTHFFSSFSL